MVIVLIDVLTSLISALGYVGIFFPMVLDTCFVPGISFIVIPLSGFLVSEGIFNLHLVAFVGAFGNTFGAFWMYYLGKKISEEKLIGIIGRYGKYILLKKCDYVNAKEFLTTSSNIKIFLGRWLPAVRNVISLPAGVVRINMYSFLFFSFIGSLSWCYLLAVLGNNLGKNWVVVRESISKFEGIIYLMFLILVGIFVYKRLFSKETSSNH